MRSLTRKTRGFSLLEVVIALAILAMSLTVLLESQASSVRSVGRSRDLTIATLLARSRMIDIEQELFDEGFTLGETTDDGDFEEEGYAEIKWESKISELEMDLSSLSSMCGAFSDPEAEDGDAAAGVADCEAMMGGAEGLGGGLTGFMDELGRSLRLVELTVTWPAGRYKESFTLRAFVTRDDFGVQPAGLGGAGAIQPGGSLNPVLDTLKVSGSR